MRSMVELLLTHASLPEHRESIREKGLLMHKPTEDGRYVNATYQYLNDQPKGVYCTFANNEHNKWKVRENEDVWQFVWTGNMGLDPFFVDTYITDEPKSDVLVVFNNVPKQNLQLISESSNE